MLWLWLSSSAPLCLSLSAPLRWREKEFSRSATRKQELRCVAPPQSAARQEAATYDYSGVFPEHPVNARRVAIFAQAAWLRQQEWGEMLQCVRNTAAAAGQSNMDVHVFVSVLDPKLSEPALTGLQASLATLPKSGVSKACSLVTENQGADVGQFLSQLEALTQVDATALTVGYELMLKIHSKTAPGWRERGHESMCGTPAQVHSIFELFGSNPKLGMVAPLGTVFGPDSPVSHIYSGIAERYKWTGTAAPAFDAHVQAELSRWRQLITQQTDDGVARGGSPQPLRQQDMQIVAGSVFWSRPSDLRVMGLLQLLPSIRPGLSRGYQENGGMEHILERLFATNIKADGRLIASVPPAPKPVALYFPQYYDVPENDRFWGKGFTEWTLLRPSSLADLQKPLSWEEGGLGYYDLTNLGVRKRQGELARAAGVQAFCFYHYWFSGKGAPANHKVMFKVIEERLMDGEPNTDTFMLSWANEPWSRRWTGGANAEPGAIGGAGDTTLLAQDYGNEEEWRAHFEYLLQFFRHPRYLRVEGKPVLAVYRVDHIAERLAPMCNLWRQLAQQAGLPGVFFLDTVGNFHTTDKITRSSTEAAHLDGSFHFWPQLLGSGFRPNYWTSMASGSDLAISTPKQYWGTFTGFDRRVRDATATPQRRSPQDFAASLRQSFEAMSRSLSWNINQNLFFITAFNEWNEQAVLEPSIQHRFEYLQVLHRAVHCVPGVVPWAQEVIRGACA